MSKKRDKINCPLCGSEAPLKEVNKTPFWACTECPFVGMESYTSVDFQKLANYYGQEEVDLMLK